MRNPLRRLAGALASGDVRRRRADQAQMYRLARARAYRSAAADILTGEHGAPQIGADREWAVHQWLMARATQIEQAGRATHHQTERT